MIARGRTRAPIARRHEAEIVNNRTGVELQRGGWGDSLTPRRGDQVAIAKVNSVIPRDVDSIRMRQRDLRRKRAILSEFSCCDQKPKRHALINRPCAEKPKRPGRNPDRTEFSGPSRNGGRA